MGIHAEKFLNQQVAVLCARWQYRGVLLGIYNDHLILNPSMGVVSSGLSEGEEPEEEHTIVNGVMIKKDAVEIIYRPAWCEAPLEAALETGIKVVENAKCFTDTLQQFQDRRLIVIGARYSYRGVLCEVDKDYLVFDDVTALTFNPPFDIRSPDNEDPIKGAITISADAIECFYQPKYLTHWQDE